MNSLQQGQYALTTKGECNKSVFFVKLTDSAMQSIEMYQSSKKDYSLKPTIQFQENNGVISIPINGEKQNYRFTLSNIEADGLQGSFQCLAQIHNRSLKSLGVLLKRMHIHANEDSYEKTKFKMEAVDKEQKSLCTKEIKSNGTLMGHKFKRKRPGLVLSPNKFQSAVFKSEPSKFQLKSKSVNSAGVIEQPIRKRIIHILAIKPYKKPELLLRLRKEGIHDNDKKKFDNILSSVGTLKENVYNLSNNLWNEVQDDWEFCTKEELQLIQRKKQQFLKLRSDTEVTQNNSSALQKPISSELIVEKEPLNKKRRISHNALRNTNQVVKDNSSVSVNCNKNKLPTVSNTETFPSVHLQVNGNSNGSAQRNKDSIISFKKNFVSSQNLKNSCDHINGDNHISDLSHNMSSNEQKMSCSNFKTDVSNYKNSKKKQKQAVINKNSVTLPNEMFNCQMTNSERLSKNHVKNLVGSQKDDKTFRRYEYSNTHDCVSNKTSHTNSISVIDKSKVISPISCSNSCDSSLGNKSKYTGSDTKYLSIIDTSHEFEYSDCIQTYKPIESKEQRSQYAKEFNAHYEDYLKLHSQVKNTSLKIQSLNDSLNMSEDGSIDFKKSVVIKEQNLLNSNYIHAWKKFNFLQSKLSHIKRLIKDYDSSSETAS